MTYRTRRVNQLWTIDQWEQYWVVAGWVEDLDFDLQHVQMHQVEVRVYGCKLVAVLEAEAKVLGIHTAAVEGRARQIDHIHHVEVEELVKQLEQSSEFAMEELEKRIYRTPVLVVRAMLIGHRTAAGVEQRMAVVGGIHLVKAHILAAVVEVVVEPGKTDASGKKVEVAVVGIAGTATAAEVEAARCIAEEEELVDRIDPVADLHIQM
jgi:hypothetical protein